MSKLTVKFVREITVIDPDTNAPVEVTILKLETGGMIGIDSTFLANTEEPVYSPFDNGVEVDVENYEQPKTVPVEQPTKVLIVVEKGMVTHVCSNDADLQYVVCDFDNEEPVEYGPQRPDWTGENLHEFIGTSTESRRIAKESLTNLNF